MAHYDEKEIKRIYDMCRSELGLRDWLYANRTGNEKYVKIINLMNGGKVHVPPAAIGTFTSKYADYIDSGKRDLCYSELVTPGCFKMFYDVDLKGETVESPEYLEKMIDILHKATMRYFPDSPEKDLIAIICTTQTGDVSIEKENSIDGRVEIDKVPGKKTGYHIIYPNLRVNAADARQIRFSSVKSLISGLGERDAGNTWSSVIDDSPYTGGLKMCGSVKVLVCPCGKKARNRSRLREKASAQQIQYVRERKSNYPRTDKGFQYNDTDNLSPFERKNPTLSSLAGNLELNCDSTCTLCGSDGMVFEKRWYTASYAIDSDGVTCDYHTNILESSTEQAMILTSIRCIEGDTRTVETLVIPDGFSVLPPGYNRGKFGKRSDRERFASGDSYPDDTPVNISENGFYELTSVQNEKLLKIIRSIHPAYSELQIHRVEEMEFPKKKRKANGEKFFKITVDGLGHTFCNNKRANHTSNSVYFIMSIAQFKQKCFSGKEYNGCVCNEYSMCFTLHDDLKNLFFREDSGVSKRGVGETGDVGNPTVKKVTREEKYGGDFF